MHESKSAFGQLRFSSICCSDAPTSEVICNAANPHGDRMQARTVLILEDEALVSLMLEDLVREMGARAIDVFAAASEALRAIAARRYDLAVLDIVVRDGVCTPVADALDEQGIPFIFSSAIGSDALEPRHRHRPLVTKPFEDAVLRGHLAAFLPATPLAP